MAWNEGFECHQDWIAVAFDAIFAFISFLTFTLVRHFITCGDLYFLCYLPRIHIFLVNHSHLFQRKKIRHILTSEIRVSNMKQFIVWQSNGIISCPFSNADRCVLYYFTSDQLYYASVFISTKGMWKSMLYNAACKFGDHTDILVLLIWNTVNIHECAVTS